MTILCACGRPLHYTDPTVQWVVENFIRDLGETTEVETPAGRWLVPRHYIALHGIKADELPALAVQLGFKRVT